MLDEVLCEATSESEAGGWGLPARPVIGDAGYGYATEFRLGLAARGLSYVVAVKGTTSAYPVEAAPAAARPPPPRRPPAVGGARRRRATATSRPASPGSLPPPGARPCAGSPG